MKLKGVNCKMIDLWDVRLEDGATVGPFSHDQLRYLSAIERIQPDTFIKRRGDSSWNCTNDISAICNRSTLDELDAIQPKLVSAVSPECQALLAARPVMWGLQFLALSLIDEVRKYPPLQVPSESLWRAQPIKSSGEGAAWWQRQASCLDQILARFRFLAPSRSQDALFGPHGHAGNEQLILQFARSTASVYEALLNWTSRCYECCPIDDWARRLGPFGLRGKANMGINMLNSIRVYGPNSLRDIRRQIESCSEDDVPLRLILDSTETKRATFLKEIPEYSCFLPVLPFDADPDVNESSSKSGFIYVLTNPSFGQLLKIGKTARNPIERAAELSATTGVPTPFQVVFSAFVDECHEVERRIHLELERVGCRVDANREFFSCSLETAIAVIVNVQRSIATGR